jgi:putative membrane protein
MEQSQGFTRYQLVLLGLLGVAWVAFAISPNERQNWLLENALVAVFAPLVIVTARYFRLSDLSYTLIALYLVLHLAGSHFNYSEVPFGFTLGRWLGTERNLFDRLVHFCFGFLLAYPMRELFHRIASVRGFWGYFLPLDLTLSLSALYEIVEWLVAEAVDPGAGAAFLGSQGDQWDAQKDVALAGLGALLAMSVIAAINWWYDPGFWAEIKESFRVKNQKPLGEVRLGELITARRNQQAPPSLEPEPQPTRKATSKSKGKGKRRRRG